MQRVDCEGGCEFGCESVALFGQRRCLFGQRREEARRRAWGRPDAKEDAAQWAALRALQVIRNVIGKNRKCERTWPRYPLSDLPNDYSSGSSEFEKADTEWCAEALRSHSFEESVQRLLKESSHARGKGEKYAIRTAADAALRWRTSRSALRNMAQAERNKPEHRMPHDSAVEKLADKQILSPASFSGPIDLQSIIRHLPRPHRETLLLMETEGDYHRVIEQLMNKGFSASAAKKRWVRALLALKSAALEAASQARPA